MAEVEW
jgi:hypothetical protein